MSTIKMPTQTSKIPLPKTSSSSAKVEAGELTICSPPGGSKIPVIKSLKSPHDVKWVAIKIQYLFSIAVKRLEAVSKYLISWIEMSELSLNDSVQWSTSYPSCPFGTDSQQELLSFLPNFFIFQPDIFVPFLRHLVKYLQYLCCDVSWNVSIVVTQRQIKKTTSSAMSASRSLGSPTSGASTVPPGNCRMLTEATGATTLTSLAPALQTPDCPSLNCQLHLPRGKTNTKCSDWKFSF